MVSGTGPVGCDDADVAGQTDQCLTLIASILKEAGTSFEHVVRSRIYLTSREDWEAAARVHGKFFSLIRPAATMVIVAGLLDPRWKVEIEVDALLPEEKDSELKWQSSPSATSRLDSGKRVLIRVDFNVPLSKDAVPSILDDTRIRETIPTIEYALRRKARVILCSHLGRPKGKVVPALSLRPVVDRLRELLDHVLGPQENVGFARTASAKSPPNSSPSSSPDRRFCLRISASTPKKRANDPAFAKQLAALCDVYVNDAFGSAHRAHASTEGITHFVGKSAAGLLMESELKHLGKALTSPDKPFVAIIGGAKVSDKISVIEA